MRFTIPHICNISNVWWMNELIIIDNQLNHPLNMWPKKRIIFLMAPSWIKDIEELPIEFDWVFNISWALPHASDFFIKFFPHKKFEPSHTRPNTIWAIAYPAIHSAHGTKGDIAITYGHRIPSCTQYTWHEKGPSYQRQNRPTLFVTILSNLLCSEKSQSGSQCTISNQHLWLWLSKWWRNWWVHCISQAYIMHWVYFEMAAEICGGSVV